MRRLRAHKDGMHNRKGDLDQSRVVFWDDFTTPSLAVKWEGTGIGVYTTGSGYVWSNTSSKYITPLMRFDFTKVVHIQFWYKYDSAGGARDLAIYPKHVGCSETGFLPYLNLCTYTYPTYNIFGEGQQNTAFTPIGSGTWAKVDLIYGRDVHRIYVDEVLKITRTERLCYPNVAINVDVHGTFSMKKFSVRYSDSPFLACFS